METVTTNIRYLANIKACNNFFFFNEPELVLNQGFLCMFIIRDVNHLCAYFHTGMITFIKWFKLNYWLRGTKQYNSEIYFYSIITWTYIPGVMPWLKCNTGSRVTLNTVLDY